MIQLKNTKASMLEELDNIKWSTLHHAYGAADDVPDLLRAALSSDNAVRDNAINDLYSTIWHQGTIYEATAYAVPFLINMFSSPTTPDRTAIAGLIACIASGRGYLEVHARPGWGEDQWRSILDKKGKNLEDEIKREAAVTTAVKHEVKKALSLLTSYLTDPDPQIRASIAETLAAFSEYREAHLQVLEQALAREADDEVRERILNCIKQLTN